MVEYWSFVKTWRMRECWSVGVLEMRKGFKALTQEGMETLTNDVVMLNLGGEDIEILDNDTYIRAAIPYRPCIPSTSQPENAKRQSKK